MIMENFKDLKEYRSFNIKNTGKILIKLNNKYNHIAFLHKL